MIFEEEEEEDWSAENWEEEEEEEDWEEADWEEEEYHQSRSFF